MGQTRAVYRRWPDPHRKQPGGERHPAVRGGEKWLFSGSPRGADASAAIYSIIEPTKANHLEPYRYLRYLFAKIPFIESDAEYNALLPTRINPKTIDQFYESGAVY